MSVDAFPDDLVAIGRIRRHHGLTGHLLVEPLSWDPRRLDSSDELLMWDGRFRTPVRVLEWSDAPGCWKVLFDRWDNPESAKAATGAYLCVPAEQAIRPKDGWIEADLVGRPLIDATDQTLGIVRGVVELPQGPALRVEHGRHDVLIPLHGPFRAHVEKDGSCRCDRDLWDAMAP